MASLADLLGDPRAANPTLADLGTRRAMPGPNAPMPTDEEIARYLAATTQDYPKFGGGGIPVNPDAFASAVAGWPQSLNIDDRRGMRGAFRR